MTIRLLILFLTVFGINHNNHKVVTGNLNVGQNTEFNISYVSIIIKIDNIPFDTVETNSQGRFSISIPNKKSKNIDILYSGIGFATVYLRYIKDLTPDTTNLVIAIPTIYKKNVLGKAYCPKCSKADMTYKIIYGDAPIYTLQVNNKGDTISSSIYKGDYQAGTCVSSAQSSRWYCDRDKIEF
jgi:hypothetical protein